MPRITRVTVGASRKFNDPVESYANHSASVTLDAEVLEGEDYHGVVMKLQDVAKVFVDSEHRRIVAKANAEYEERLERDRQERAARLAESRSKAPAFLADDLDDEEEGFGGDDEDEPF